MNLLEELERVSRPGGTNEFSMEHMAQLVRLCAATVEQLQWRPIETAPVNKSVLIWIPRAEHYGPPIYRGMLVDMGTGRRWTVNGLSIGRDCGDRQPTHWMPLPEPPLSAET